MSWKNWIIFKPISDMYNMFFNNDKGFSLRKFGFVAAVIFAYLAFNRLKEEKYILDSGNIWLIFAGICIGLITVPDLIKAVTTIFKGKTDETKPE